MFPVPLFPAKREVFAWIKNGRKTVDVRKGRAWRGEVAVIQSGASYLRFRIVKKETGKLSEVIRSDNFLAVIPTAETVDDALAFLRGIYGNREGVFTAYYLAKSDP